MHRTEDQYAASGGQFTDGPPGTRVTKDWLNAVQEELANVIIGAGYNLKNKQTDTYDQLYTAIRKLVGLTITQREYWTRLNGGQWCDWVWKDTDEFLVKCKSAQGLGSFIGVVLNDNTYYELQSDYAVKYDTPGAGGHIIDGITAKLNSEWFIAWFYKNSAGSLAVGLTWMPNLVLDTDDPTNVLVPKQINAQDVCYLVPVDAHLGIFQDTDEWETPHAWQNAGAVTYDATKDKPKVLSRTSTTITLTANLENNNMKDPAKIFQVDGFKPVQVSDGAIASVIGSNPYRDSGFRMRSGAAGTVMQFTVEDNGKAFLFSNGTGAADYAYNTGVELVALAAAYTNFKLVACPNDKTPICEAYSGGGAVLAEIVTKRYYDTYGETSVVGGSNVISSSIISHTSRVIHGILSGKGNGTSPSIAIRGYLL